MRLRARAFVMAQLPKQEAIAMADKEATAEEKTRSLLRWNWRFKAKSMPENTLASMADPEQTVCFVSIDAGMGSDLLNIRVLKRLEELLPEQKGGKRLCHLENLSIR